MRFMKAVASLSLVIVASNAVCGFVTPSPGSIDGKKFETISSRSCSTLLFASSELKVEEERVNSNNNNNLDESDGTKKESILLPLLSPFRRRRNKSEYLNELYTLRRNSNSNSINKDNDDSTTTSESNNDPLSDISSPYNQYLFQLLDSIDSLEGGRSLRISMLKKTLDLIVPDVVKGEEDQQKLLRGQNLAAILAQCQKRRGGIYRVYLDARKNTKTSSSSQKKKNNSVSMKEMLERTPSLETPSYKVIYEATPSTGDDSDLPEFEVRQYDSHAVVSTQTGGGSKKSNTTSSSSSSSMGGGFNKLAGYIFGRNQESEKMAMTTPVFMSSQKESDRTMSFVLPSKFWENEEAVMKSPTPLSSSSGESGDSEGEGDADAAIIKRSFVPESTRAVLWFGGLTTNFVVSQQEQKLEELIEKDGMYQVKKGAKFIQANYNDPFTSPWKRRNEIMIDVEPKTQVPL